MSIIKRLKKIYKLYRTSKIVNTPINPNKIAIMTNTNFYTCNPKYIYEELVRRNKGYEIVWLVNTPEVDRTGYPEDAKVLSIETDEGNKAAYSAKMWIDNGIAFSNHFDKKEGQIHIQTMHGSLGIKRLDNAVLSRNARGRKGQHVVYRETYETDYVITNSKFEEDVFKTVFWKNTPKMRFGHARTDVLFETDPARIDEIREALLTQYNIPKDKKIVLFGPTHRKGLEGKDIYIDYKKLTDSLAERFGGEFVALIRMHQRTKDVMMDGGEYDDVLGKILFDVTDYPDIQELMLVTDVGITDYSSWIYDYVNIRRPGFIFATDLDRYNNNTGLYYPLEETPFPVCRSSEELCQKAAAFDMELFQKRTEEFLTEKQAVDDGHSAERIVDWIEQLLK